MISQMQIQKLHEIFSELKNKGKSLRKSTDKIVFVNGENTVIYVRTLFDGDDSLCSMFISSVCTNLNCNVKFEYLPITKAIDSDLSLILISDDTEIDNEIAERLEKRKKTDAPTFPLIIFSDEYFVLRDGESLAYVQTCDTLRDKSERPIMPFRRQDLFKRSDILSLYIECIAQIATMYSLRKSLETMYKNNVIELEAAYTKYTLLSNDGDMEHMLEKLSLNSNLTVLTKSCVNIKGLVKNIKSLEDELDGFVNTLHEEYDRHIDSIVTHKSINEKSAYSVALDLKYGALNSYLKKLCTEAEREFLYDKLSVNLSKIISYTRSTLDSKAAEIAFIGTFSSGKTTLINTLLGHKHKLRTSGAHNTAVLMELVSTQDKEHYEIVYKDILKWDLINYTSFENKNIVNTFDCNARVISVDKNSAGSTIVRYQAVTGAAIRVAEIGSGHTLAVTKGSVVRSKESFINQTVDKNVVKLCSINELNYIEKLLSSNSISDIKLSTLGGEIRNVMQIRQIISQLRNLYSNSTKNYAQPTKNIDVIKAQWKGDFEKLEKCTFECRLSGFKPQSFILDDAGWEKFTGSETKSIAPFCESPACYMPAKVVRVYLNSEFLKYCSITDTPGFGSITDEHDAITERYLRDSNGKLVVMITINNHSLDKKLDDLLHNISGVFKNFRESHMRDVCFMLNCFTNLLPLEQCQKIVNEIQNKIRHLGFTNNDIYVDNLKQVLGSNTEKRVFIEPFQSYYSFKNKCLGDFLNDSIDKKYKSLQHMWNNFFNENINWIDNMTEGFAKTLSSKESRISELSNAIRQIESLNIDMGESLIDEVRKSFDNYFYCFDSAFRGNRKGFFTAVRWNAVSSVLDSFKDESKTWELDEEKLGERMGQAFRRLSFYSRTGDSESIDFTPSHRLIVATFEKIRSKLDEADDNTHFYNKSKKSDYYMSQLRDIMNQDKAQSVNNIMNYCSIYKQKFDEKKRFILCNLRDELAKSSDREALQDEINRFKDLRSRLQMFKKDHFDVIEFKINGGNIWL